MQKILSLSSLVELYETARGQLFIYFIYLFIYLFISLFIYLLNVNFNVIYKTKK